LKRKNAQFSKERKRTMAVYANDWIGAQIFLRGKYERENIEDLMALFPKLGIIKSGCAAIDIGANIGNHTIEFAEYFDKVYSFEPNPNTYKLLEYNCQGINNVKLFNLGLSDKIEELELHELADNLGGSSAIYHGESCQTVHINTKPLDMYIEEMNDVEFIKIDVEGMEIKVLTGAEKLIRKICTNSL